MQGDGFFEERSDIIQRKTDPAENQAIGPVADLRVKVIRSKIGHAPARFTEGLPGDCRADGVTLENAEHFLADTHLIGELEDELLFFFKLCRRFDHNRRFFFSRDINGSFTHIFCEITASCNDLGLDGSDLSHSGLGRRKRLIPHPEKILSRCPFGAGDGKLAYLHPLEIRGLEIRFDIPVDRLQVLQPRKGAGFHNPASKIGHDGIFGLLLSGMDLDHLKAADIIDLVIEFLRGGSEEIFGVAVGSGFGVRSLRSFLSEQWDGDGQNEGDEK